MTWEGVTKHEHCFLQRTKAPHMAFIQTLLSSPQHVLGMVLRAGKPKWTDIRPQCQGRETSRKQVHCPAGAQGGVGCKGMRGGGWGHKTKSWLALPGPWTPSSGSPGGTNEPLKDLRGQWHGPRYVQIHWKMEVGRWFDSRSTGEDFTDIYMESTSPRDWVDEETGEGQETEDSRATPALLPGLCRWTGSSVGWSDTLKERVTCPEDLETHIHSELKEGGQWAGGWSDSQGSEHQGLPQPALGSGGSQGRGLTGGAPEGLESDQSVSTSRGRLDCSEARMESLLPPRGNIIEDEGSSSSSGTGTMQGFGHLPNFINHSWESCETGKCQVQYLKAKRQLDHRCVWSDRSMSSFSWVLNLASSIWNLSWCFDSIFQSKQCKLHNQ